VPKRNKIKTNKEKTQNFEGALRISRRFVNGIEIDEKTFFETTWTNENAEKILRSMMRA